ncbi:hypothetical protein C8Q80DRAFT_1267461 [Daedaleopsis nitida]|nr:hypothetical protein C8Q80DRAFT_1267461 [Daedaleopsis nitida]
MLSAPRILADEGFPALNNERARMDSVLYQLDVLRPAGFPVNKPQERHASTKDVFIKLNCKYCRLAILAAAYNVRSINNVGDMLDHVDNHARTHEEIVGLMDTLTPLERNVFGGILKAFKKGIQAYKLFLDDSRDYLDMYKPLFRVLDQFSLDLLWYVERLKTPVLPRQPVLNMLPHVTALCTFQKECFTLEKRTAAIYANLVGILLTRGYMWQEVFNTRFQEYASITIALKEQLDPQNTAIIELTLRAMPSVLPGLEVHTVVSIADLRKAHVYFECVNEALENMDENAPPLRAGHIHNTDALNQRLAVLVIP